MKKLFVLGAMILLAFTACEQPTNEDNSPELPSLTIINQSSYVLTDVKFSGILLSAPNANGLPVSSSATVKLSADDVGQPVNIFFTRDDIKIELRTAESYTVTADRTITFTDNTLVQELGNPSNSRALAQITFLSTITVEHDSRTVAKYDRIDLGEAVVTYTKQNVFVIKNASDGKLLFGVNNPVQISGDDAGVFSVVQPTGSEIAANGSLSFTIVFNPKAVQQYTASVSITSSAQNGDDGIYNFTISANGVASKPIATVLYDGNEIPHLETIDMGILFITEAKNITLTIRNTGTEVLAVDTANIAIGGTNASSFGIISRPTYSISAGGQSSMSIEYRPVQVGPNDAILTIPTNDTSNASIIIYLRGNAQSGTAILELSQSNTIIRDDDIEPFDFGMVRVSQNKTLAFTIKNTGNIPLELLGDPRVESSSPVFSVFTQPSVTTLTLGAETSFTIRYQPSSEGADHGTITIVNNGSVPVFSFDITGTGFIDRPQINIRQGVNEIEFHGEYDFGTIAAGKSSNITFTINNSGEANLEFVTVDGNRVTLLDNDVGLFAITQQPSATTVLTPGSSTSFVVSFNPTTTGSNFTATVQIVSNSRNNDEFTFRVKGSARMANSEARLSGLEFTAGTLSPAFNANIDTYDLRIDAGTAPTLINVRPTSMDSGITEIRVNGISQNSGVPSQDIILASTSTVTTIVTAEDGITTATYTVNIKIINTWERLHGQAGRRYGVYKAISNGSGGLYASGYAGSATAALFNFDQNGNLQNTFTFSSNDGTVGPVALGMEYNDYYSVYWGSNLDDYYITKATNPAVSPATIRTSLQMNNNPIYMLPVGIVKNGWYFVAGAAHYAASTTATSYSYGLFVNRHYSDGTWEKGTVLSLNYSGINTGTFETIGMALLSNGDVLIYGYANTTSGRRVAVATAININAENAASWTVRWTNTYEITNKTSAFYSHFIDDSSNIILLGGSDDGGFVVKFPLSATTAATAKPSGWPKTIAGTNGIFIAGLAASDGGYLLVGESTGTYGGLDTWVVKTDVNANKTWEKFYGGTGDEWAQAVIEQSDSYIIAGATLSPTIAGQSRTGTEDIYILKINKDGSMD